MDPRQRIRCCCRRAASSSAAAATGIGTAALASLLNPRLLAERPQRARRDRRRAAGHAALRAEGQAGHLPVHVRRPVADRPVRLQAEDGRAVRQGPARLDPHGAAADDDDLRPEAVSRSPRRCSSSSSTASPGPGSASCCRTRPRSSTTWPSSRRCTPRRSTTTRRSPTSRPGSQLPGRPSLGAWLSYGLGSSNENLPAFVVLHSDLDGANATPRRSTRGSGAAASCRREHQGVSLRSSGDPVLYLSNPPGVEPRRAAPDARRLWPS